MSAAPPEAAGVAAVTGRRGGLRSGVVLAAGLLALATTVGSCGDRPVACSSQSVLAFVLTVVEDGHTEGCDVSVTATAGPSFAEILRPGPGSSCRFDGPVDRPGAYTITVTAGTARVVRTVTVTRGRCRVRPQAVTIAISRQP
jgi:hypothetical protein